MTFFVRDAVHADILKVTRRMRAIDAKEIFCGRFDDNPATLADELALAGRMAIKQLALGMEHRPVAILAAYLVSPVVAQVAMFATDEWPRIAKSAHAYVRKLFIPCVLTPNVLRAECRVYEENFTARRWLKRLRFTEETMPFALGNEGERFVQMAWLNPDFPGFRRP